MVGGLKDMVWRAVLRENPEFERQFSQNELVQITSKDVNMISKRLNGPDFRNLSKFDKQEDLPDVFQEKRINILPISRREFILGRMAEYADFETKKEAQVKKFVIPNLSTLQGTSAKWNENSWISAALSVNAFEEAFEDEDLIRTITGRMGAGNWQFEIQSDTTKKHQVQLANPQIEIDTVLETSKAIYIIEAKRVRETNFLVRQLYFPYRTLISEWNITNKPVVPVFYEINAESQYARIRIFDFDNPLIYNSIREVKRFEFQLIDANEQETLTSLLNYANSVITRPASGNLFPQANDMTKCLAIMTLLAEKPLNKFEIAQHIGFDPRQGEYYAKNLLMYFGFAEMIDNKFTLTTLGKKTIQLPVGQRNVLIAREILRLRAFNRLFALQNQFGSISTQDIVREMVADGVDNVLGKGTIARRASTVKSIINWIFLQVNN
jgi:hypothetical protein